MEQLEKMNDILADLEREEAHNEAPELLPTEEDINAWAKMLYEMKKRKNN